MARPSVRIPAFVDLVRALQPGQRVLLEAFSTHQRAILTALAYYLGTRYRTRALTNRRAWLERIS